MVNILTTTLEQSGVKKEDVSELPQLFDRVTDLESYFDFVAEFHQVKIEADCVIGYSRPPDGYHILDVNGPTRVAGEFNVTLDSSFNGNVRVDQSMNILGNLDVQTFTFLHDDVVADKHLQVIGDASFESNVEIVNNLIIHNSAYIDHSLNVTGKTFLTDDVSMSNHLLVLGDVSFQQDLEVDHNLMVHDSVYIDNSLNVTGKTFLTDDVSMSNHLLVLGDVSFQQDLEISDNLIVHDSVYIDNSLMSQGKHSLPMMCPCQTIYLF